MSGASLRFRSPAKINWCLRVLGRRQDGFHDLASLVSAVTLTDELTFCPRSEPGIDLVCDRPGLPADKRNLIVMAGLLLAEAAGCTAGATCRLVKRIPVGGGLGGGSSNGASALLALNQLWGLDWPIERIAPLAARLGSDVSFFLWGGSAVMTGRGESIRPVSVPWDGWVVLLLPRFSTSTAEVYSNWRMPERQPAHTPMDDIMAGESGSPMGAEEWMQAAYNMLEEPLRRVCPAIGPLIDAASELAGRPVRVSGSGSTLFTAFDTREEADCFAADAGKRIDLAARVVRVEQPCEVRQGTVVRAGEQAARGRRAM